MQLHKEIDNLKANLQNKLYNMNDDELLQDMHVDSLDRDGCMAWRFDDLVSFDDDMGARSEQCELYLEDVQTHVKYLLGKMKESAEFFGENAESFQSAEEALTLYLCFFVPGHNGVEHLLSKSLTRPTGIPQHTQQSTSVVVRFLSGEDEYISGHHFF